MWVCLNDAFLSIVYKDGQENELCVRARHPEHIQRVFPLAKVIETKDGDYHYRSFIDRDEVIEVVSERFKQLAYSNFKRSVKEIELHNAYCEVWATMAHLQEL